MTRYSLNLLHRTLQKEIVDNDNRPNTNTFNRDVDGKIIIENALKIFTKAVKDDIELFNKFKTHQEDGFAGKDIDLIKNGCFNEELRVRIAFRDNLIEIPRHFNEAAHKPKKLDVLKFLMEQLDNDFFKVRDEDRTSSFTHEYFGLFTNLVIEKSETDNGGSLYENLRELLGKVRDMVKL